MEGREILPMLDSDSEEVKLRGMISDLRWLNVLLKNRFDLDIKRLRRYYCGCGYCFRLACSRYRTQYQAAEAGC